MEFIFLIFVINVFGSFSTKRLRIMDTTTPDDDEAASTSKSATAKATDRFRDSTLTADEHIALELYESLRKKKEDIEDEEDSDEQEGAAAQGNAEQPAEEEEEEDSRRSITYQIQKNKGLAPKRSKLQRNPRVKHRVKFEKAKVRRKGQVREVRTEVKKYGGELFGINARVKKGVKLA